MSNHTPHLQFRRGATSLLVVVGMSMVLIAIVSGLTVLSVREQRQAIDTDLSNRAINAAEAAARDAANLLVDNPNMEYPNCDGSASANLGGISTNDLTHPTLTTGADNDVSIQCRTVVSTSTKIVGQIARDDSTQINAIIDPVAHIILDWNKIGTDSTNSEPPSGLNFYPTIASYTNRPAGMEITLIYWPKGGIPSAFLAGEQQSNLKIRSFFVMPEYQDRSPVRNQFNVGSQFGNKPNSPLGSSCSGGTPTGQFSCSMVIDVQSLIGVDPAANNYVLRITPRYHRASFQASFFQTTGASTPDARVKNTKALIDVTAKAGNLYRRIQAEKPIGNLAFLDSVLYSEDKICKKLSVKEDYSLINGNTCN